MRINIYKLAAGVKQSLFTITLILFLCKVYGQTTYTFNYTGGVQTVNLLAGNYKIECWGADGGSLTANTALPGKGGYSKGDIALNAATTFSIYVGGKGNGGAQPLGGFNSGNGTTKTNVGTATGGGGASDVRVLVDDFLNRIIVAGGGGGQGTSTGTGGNGGGLVGQDGQGTTNFGIGGTQNAPGVYPAGGDSKPAAFGEGSDGPAGTTGGQGGGGWYGGSFGTRTNGGGAGGSGYVLTSTSFTPTGYFSAHPNYYFTNDVTLRADQANFVPNPVATGDGLILITELCNITLTATGMNANGICVGNSVTLTTNAVSNYSWSTGASSSSLVVSPGSTTLYSLTATSASNCTSSAALTVTVNPLPVLSAIAHPSLLCVASSATITAMGASTYTWAGGSVSNTLSVNPSVSTVYSYTGTSAAGCDAIGTVNVPVNTLTITVPLSVSVCKGKPLNVIASGGISYMWSNGSPFGTLVANPLASTSYTLDAIDANYCDHTHIVNVTVNNNPTVTASADKSMICRGEPVTLTAGGTATSYTWNNPPSTTAVVTLTPAIDITYYYDVTGADNNGCESTAVVSVKVERCSGLYETGSLAAPLDIFPNPNNGSFTIKSQKNLSLEISNELGQVIKRIDISAQTDNQAVINDLPAGVYFISTSDRSVNYKIVVSK